MDPSTSKEKDVLRVKRKIPKPIIEKRRRARINCCLNELKNLVVEKELLVGQRNSKLEKADILELTVEYLKRKAKPSDLANVLDSDGYYEQGFRECLNQISNHLHNTSADRSLSESLVFELDSFAKSLTVQQRKSHGEIIQEQKLRRGSLERAPLSESLDKTLSTSDLQRLLPFITPPSPASDASTDDYSVDMSSISPMRPVPLNNEQSSTPSVHCNTSSNSPNTTSNVNQQQCHTTTAWKVDHGDPTVNQSKVCHGDAAVNHVNSTQAVLPMCQLINSVQSFTLLLPCQVLTPCLPPATVCLYPPTTGNCEHSDVGRRCPVTSAFTAAATDSAFSLKANRYTDKISGHFVGSVEVLPSVQMDGKDEVEFPPLPPHWRPW